jgi:hypothetical protein
MSISCIIRSKKLHVKQKYNKKEICPHLKFGNSLNNTKVIKYQVVEAILYRLKTGCQRWKATMAATTYETIF